MCKGPEALSPWQVQGTPRRAKTFYSITHICILEVMVGLLIELLMPCLCEADLGDSSL